jgi:putative flippase GtrA
VKDLIRFLAVNGGCFVLDIALLLALHHLAHASAGVAATIAFAFASAVNFILSRQWVFAQTARGGNPRADLLRYVGLVSTGLLLTAVVVSGLAHLGLDYRLAKLAASGMVGILNFIVLPRWVFSGDRSPVLTPDETPEPASAAAGE